MTPFLVLVSCASIIAVAAGVVVWHKPTSAFFQRLGFGAITIPGIVGVLYLTTSSVVTMVTAETHGPVHWHADFEIYHCGAALDLINPRGLSNRVGTPLLHEHGDNRIHVEGTVMDRTEVSLGYFFTAVGGELTPTSIRLPTTSHGLIFVTNGDRCPSGQPGRWQMFVYSIASGAIVQRPVPLAPDYVIAQAVQVPPGDCIILEFSDRDLPSTEHICSSYTIYDP